MFERFTNGARRVVVLATEEARMLGHTFIGTEHLLLGMLHDENGGAWAVLTSLGVTREKVRAEVEQYVGRGDVAPTGRIPFTPRAKKVLELALREAFDLGDDHVATHHLLLGVVREGEGVAAQILLRLGASTQAVRTKVAELKGTAGSEIEAGVDRAAVAAPDGPRCPGCRSDLTTALTARAVTVTAGPADRDGGEQEVAVLYCRECGRAIGVLPHSSSAAS